MSLQIPTLSRSRSTGNGNASGSGSTPNTKAVILVGGPSRGTRFRPLSLDVPKPLFEIAGIPIIEHCFRAIAKVEEIREVFIVGYYEESVFRDFIRDSAKAFPKIRTQYLREYQALGTAGGLYHFRDAILKGNPDRFFVLNADVCCSFPLNEMLKTFTEKNAGALILGTRVSNDAASNFGCIVSDPETKQVLHYVEKPESHISNLINCGVYLFATDNFFPAVRAFIKRRAERPRLLSFSSMENLTKMSIRDQENEDSNISKEIVRLEQDILPDLADSQGFYVLETRDFWRQIKTAGSAVPANALYLMKAFQSQSEELAKPSATILPPVFIHPTAEVDPTAKLGPNVSVGPRAVIGAGVRVKESIILEDAEIKHDACVMYSIVGWGSKIGAWARVEGTPMPLTSHDSSIIKNGVKVQSVTILGKECGVADEVRVQNCVCLPYKDLKRDVTNEVIIIYHATETGRSGLSPVILHLPRGSFLKDPTLYTPDSSISSELSSTCPNATVVQINYRLSHQHRFPTPIHDVLIGYDWVVQNLLSRKNNTQAAPKIGVCGELVGGSLALALAMTECRRGDAGRIAAAAVSNAIVDWVFPEEAPNTPASSKTHPAPLQAPDPLTHDLLTKLRLHAFNSAKPSTYFDPFASPVHFLRSPSIACPQSTSPSSPAGSSAELDQQFAALLSLDLPPETAEPPERRRKAPFRWPPATPLLISPLMRFGIGNESVLCAQTEEFTGLLRRALVKSDAASKGVRPGGRRVYGRDDGDEQEDAGADEGVLDEAKERADKIVLLEKGGSGSGLLCWEGRDGAAGGRAEVRRVGEWLAGALR